MHLQALKTLASCLLLAAAPASAFWRLPCTDPVVVERADPVISPGIVSGHVHTIMGGNGFSFDMNFASTQASTCSSCTDKSNYWVPTLYYQKKDGGFISVDQSGGGTIYYLQRSDPQDPEYSQGLIAFPNEFRMVAGNPFLRNFTNSLEANGINFACLGTNTAETNSFPNIKCPDGLRAQVFFPSCWDGVNSDSPDHKSHVAYPSATTNGYCPSTHPKRFISLFYEVTWNTPDFDDMWYGDNQPFVLSTGDPTGFGYHGDFINGWDSATLQAAITDCNDPSGVVENCQHFAIKSTQYAQGCKVPVSVDEPVFGNLTTLPGCNPIQNGPDDATPKSGCGATTVISPPQQPSVDLTQSKDFRFLGCGTDPAGQPRTLQGADYTNATSMTVELCVDFCISKGFSVAGVEFTTQCFCDNSIPNDRLPDPTLMGNCAMPCAGNDKEVCGGAALISLYQKCTPGQECKNVYYDLKSPSGTKATKAATAAHFRA
ncbi:hypothetical protein B7494_g6971 [Chlorociboria aeruginascens]|nr:hypothetical protein B7494_g6971 [Chlorociboria aeruginascens]